MSSAAPDDTILASTWDQLQFRINSILTTHASHLFQTWCQSLSQLSTHSSTNNPSVLLREIQVVTASTLDVLLTIVEPTMSLTEKTTSSNTSSRLDKLLVLINGFASSTNSSVHQAVNYISLLIKTFSLESHQRSAQVALLLCLQLLVHVEEAVVVTSTRNNNTPIEAQRTSEAVMIGCPADLRKARIAKKKEIAARKKQQRKDARKKDHTSKNNTVVEPDDVDEAAAVAQLELEQSQSQATHWGEWNANTSTGSNCLAALLLTDSGWSCCGSLDRHSACFVPKKSQRTIVVKKQQHRRYHKTLYSNYY